MRISLVALLILVAAVETPSIRSGPTPVQPPTGFVAPALPRYTVSSSVEGSPSNGRTFRLARGDNLQATLDRAQCGDKILLASGAVYSGNYVLRKACSAAAWITIATDGCATMPAEGTRTSIAAASCFAKLVASNGSAPAVQAAAGASYYRVVGVEATIPANARINYGIVALGTSGPEQTTLAQVPHHIVLDRLYVHGTAAANVQRCIALNSAWAAVVDSYISECHFKGQDAQAIVGWNGPGPFKILNNYLEGSGENILFGGADPTIPNLNPGDIEVRHNHFRKPPEWKGVWTVKNLFEIKNGVRVLLEGNVLENCWTDAQVGQAIVMQALSDNNSAAWTTVQDVTVRFNIIKNANVGAAIASRAAYGSTALVPSQPSQRISLQNNLFQAMTGGNLLQLSGDLQNASVIHNTAHVGGGSLLLMFDAPQTGLYFADNAFSHLWWGIFGNNVGEGNVALAKYAPGAVVRGNVFFSDGPPGMQNFNPDLYPPGNFFPSSTAAVGFVNVAAGDLRLGASSPYRNKATDGKDPGADIAAILSATSGVVR